VKKFILAAVLALIPSQAHAQALMPWQGGTGCETGDITVGTLPSAPLQGTICVVNDGADETDCTTGGGTKENVCIYLAGGSGVDYGWKQLDLDYTEVSDSFYVTKDTNGGLPEPSVIPSCRNGTDGGVMGYDTSAHAFYCYTTTRLAAVSTTSDPTTGLCYWSTFYRTIQCGNAVGVTTLFSTYGSQPPMLRDFELGSTGGVGACLIFEGNTDNAIETTLCATNPTTLDKAINLPDASGTVAVSATSPITLSATGDIGLTAFSGDVSSSGSTLTIGADKITEAMLKAVDAPADEECLTYESTVGDFEWQACGGGGGNSFETITPSSGTAPVADSSTDTLTVTGTSPVVVTGDSATDALTISLADGTITEALLKVVDAPADEECFTYESTTGDFEWQDCATSGTGGGTTYLKLDASNDPVTGQLAITGSSTGSMLEVTNTNSASVPAAKFINPTDSADVTVVDFQGADRTTPTFGDVMRLRLLMEDSAGNYEDMAQITASTLDPTNGAEYGTIGLWAKRNGTLQLGVALNGTNVTINDGSNDIDFRVETDGRSSMIDCDGAEDSCTFGSGTELGFVGIDGQADEIQFVIQANATQTSDLFVIENSAGTDQLTISGDGLVTDYGAEATVARGVPAIVAEVALTTQSASIAATTLYTAPAVDTTIRVSAYTIITRAATSSSTLGSLGITFTDADNTTSQNMTMRCNNRTGTSTTSVTGNSLTTSLNCEAVVRINASSAITYEQGYASSGATTMQYSTYWTVERLQ